MESDRTWVVMAAAASMAFALWLMPAVWVTGATDSRQHAWDFEDVPLGQLPTGWRVEGTNQRGPLATWQVVADEAAASGRKVLALTSPNHDSGGTFNLCWTEAVSFLNGELEVSFKAHAGREDQGGGIIWRVRDKDNYYVARFNPLEENFRLYYVKDGARKMLASATISLKAGAWHRMRITHAGDRIEGYLNSNKLLEAGDTTLTEAGGIGLWTKADAATSFDDLSVIFK